MFGGVWLSLIKRRRLFKPYEGVFMIKEDYLALILQKKDVGEADRYYTFLTRENGLMFVVAKGVRKSNARLAGHLEDYTLSQITIAKNYGPGTLAGAYTEKSYAQVRQSYQVLCALTRLRRIFLSVVQKGQRDEDLFDLMRDFFDAMDKSDPAPPSDNLFIEAVLHKLYAHLGYQFPLTSCCACGKKLHDQRNYFSPYEGGIICPLCVGRNDIKQSVVCDSNTIKMLRLINRYEFEELKKISYTQNTIRQLQVITDIVATWIMR